MKKILISILILICILSLAACSNTQEEMERLQTEYERFVPYVELIESIENNDFSKAFAILEGCRLSTYHSTVESGEIEEIVIDSSNYQEYFQVEKITEWQTNDMGETEGFITHVCIVLADEYASRIVQEQTSVNFQWQATCSVKNCTVDLDNRIIHYENLFKSNSTTFGEPENLRGTVSFDGTAVSPEIFGETYVAAEIGEIVIVGEYSLAGELKPVCFDYDAVTISEAKGVLTVYKNE